VVKVEIGPWVIPGFKITRGQLLDTVLFGLPVIIPPEDIVFWEDVELIDKITIFDTAWIAEAVLGVATDIAQAVWNLAKDNLDKWAAEFYEKRKEET